MGALDFPCERCGDPLSYSELLDHYCKPSFAKKDKQLIKDKNGDDDLEIIAVDNDPQEVKKRTFSSMGLNMWNGQSISKNSSKKKQKRPTRLSATTSAAQQKPKAVKQGVRPLTSLFTTQISEPEFKLTTTATPQPKAKIKGKQNAEPETKLETLQETKSVVDAEPIIILDASPEFPKVSAREGLKKLGLNMRWSVSKKDNKLAKPTSATSVASTGPLEVIDLEDKGNFKPTDQSKYYDKMDNLLDERTVEVKKLKYDSTFPLSEVLRPKKLKDYVGQSGIVGPEGIVTKCIYTGIVPSMILWGEPGVGKTTLVRLILTEIKNSSFSRFYQINELSAALSNLAELKSMYEKFKQMKKLNNQMRMILFLDEIHRFSKLQQDFFLSLIENNEMIFFGCTTENPSYKINDAMLSRCQIFNLKKATPEEILTVINRGVLYINRSRILLHNQKPLLITKKAKSYLSEVCDGDFRTALNTLEAIATKYVGYLSEQEKNVVEIAFNANGDRESNIGKGEVKKICIDIADLQNFLKHTTLRRNTRIQFKDLFAALYKSIMGSDANAAILYLAYIFKAETDPLEIANFLHEFLINEIDESHKLHNMSLLEMSNTAYYVVTKLGLPECDLALVQLTYLLCKAPKSRKITKTLENIESFIYENPTALSLPIPLHIRNAPTQFMKDLGYSKGYKYNPAFKDGAVHQYYLPRGIRKASFAEHSDFGNRVENLPSVNPHHKNKKATKKLLNKLCWELAEQ